MTGVPRDPFSRLDSPSGTPQDGGPAPRVAYVMSRFPKLTETFVLYEMLALEAEGADVEIFPLLRHRSRTRHPEADHLVSKARFRPFISPSILRANWFFLRRHTRAYLALWRDVVFGTWGSANFLLGGIGILPKVVLFAREMERLEVDHVHAHFANHPALAAWAIHRLTAIPYSFTAHGSDLHVERRMLRSKVQSAQFVATVSEYNRNLIVEECGEDVREKVAVIHCGVDVEAFVPSAVRDEKEGANLPLRLVCVASLEEVKGHRFLIQACRLLIERGVDLQCELVGAGPHRKRLARAITEAGLEGKVLLMGSLPRPEVLRALDRAHVAVLASHPTASGKREGIPVALMEAMAMRLPVVASALSGIPELVEHEESGLLVPPGDPSALADALARLAGNPDMRERMGKAGRDRVLREFNLRSTAGEILKHIERQGGSAPVAEAGGESPDQFSPGALGLGRVGSGAGDRPSDPATE